MIQTSDQTIGASRLSALLLGALLCACGGSSRPPPGPLQVGIARVRMPVPVGIGTVGYAGFNVDAEPSPFAEIYPATTRVHGHPEFKAVVISRGAPHEVVLLRADTIGIFQQFRRAVVLEVEKRLGRSVDDALVFGGTHTHSGPGRVIKGGGTYDVIADRFFPDFYERMVDAAATAVVSAFADLAPARLGHAFGQAPDGHADRRCEDGRDYKNSTLPVVAIQRNGRVEAVIFAYAVHGTVLGIDELTLSRDVSGAIEQNVEERFDHPVMAMFFNSWAADMSPGNPSFSAGPGADQPDGYERMSRVGRSVADAVHAALGGIAYDDAPAVFAEVRRVHLSREAIGYAEGTFPYPRGGVYCGFAEVVDCDPATVAEGMDQLCIPFTEDAPAPRQTEISAGRLGTLAFVTFPGEAGTLLAEEILRRLKDRFREEQVMFLGYSQDYTGYSLLEDDWWQGGYEAGGAIWGPRQGEYLADMCEQVFQRVVVAGPGAARDRTAPPPVDPFELGTYTPYVATPAEGAGTVVADTAPSYGATDVVTLTVQGGDPWHGTPLATLVDASGQPVQMSNGVPVDSDGYAFWIDLVPVPGYGEAPDAATRAFRWTFSMPVRQKFGGLVPDLAGGTYRLKVSLPTAGGPVDVQSTAFTVQ